MITTIIFWIVGLIITSFTVIPILIIFFFGIPTTLKLVRLGVLKSNNGIIKKYVLSLLILSVIYAIVFFAIRTFVPAGLAGLLYGGAMTLLFGLGQIGANKNNVSDYLETNKGSLLVSVEQAENAIRNG